MTEGLFILTTVFVAYVIYQIINEKKAAGETTVKPSAAATKTEPKVVLEEKPKATEPKAKPAATKTAAAKPAAPKKAVEETKVPEAVTVKGSGLKDPKTGEVATVYSNYRFTKRWIKEALVAEKLVDKVYKNDELNADTESKIKAGIAKLEGMKKYKP